MQSPGGALPDLAAHGAIRGASGVPDPTDTRARTHHDETDLSADGPRQPATGFIRGGSAVPVGNWSKEFLEAGKRRLAGDTARAATTDEVKALRHEARTLKEVVAEQALESRLMKKSMTGAGDDPA